jgi:NADPH-dependent 2,4-dienoyl-CoA reductase/sulfur reductase-like enzyme
VTGRIVIVGGVAAGASAAAKARRTNESAEIVMFDRGPYMSYANCGLPYYVGGEIASRDALFVTNPDRFTGFFRVDVRLNTAVDGICASGRTVSYIDPEKGRSTLTYDRLILATGAVPIVPPISGLNSPSIFYCRTVPDVDAIMQRLSHLLPREMEGGHFLNVKEVHEVFDLRSGAEVEDPAAMLAVAVRRRQ